MKAPKRAADAALWILEDGPTSLFALLWAMRWVYRSHEIGNDDHAASTVERRLRQMVRDGLVERHEIRAPYLVGGTVRHKRHVVWSITAAGVERVRQIDEERRAEDARKHAAEDARWWREDYQRATRSPVRSVAGWELVVLVGLAVLAHPERRERTSSWSVAGFPPGVPGFIIQQARNADARARWVTHA